jgi:hypothetical protein
MTERQFVNPETRANILTPLLGIEFIFLGIQFINISRAEAFTLIVAGSILIKPTVEKLGGAINQLDFVNDLQHYIESHTPK